MKASINVVPETKNEKNINTRNLYFDLDVGETVGLKFTHKFVEFLMNYLKIKQ